MLVDQKFRCTHCGFIRLEKNFPVAGVPAMGVVVQGMPLFQATCRRCGRNDFVAEEQPVTQALPTRGPEGWRR